MQAAFVTRTAFLGGTTRIVERQGASLQDGTRPSIKAPRPTRMARPTTQALFGGGGKTTTKAKQAMICLDCGYIYDDAAPFASLPSSYRCPVCRAPKRRFGPYNEPVPRNANDLKLRKNRKAKLQGGDEGAGLDAYVLGAGGVGTSSVV